MITGYSFQALSEAEILVLGTDGKLWLEHGPFGAVPPSRQQIATNVRAFESVFNTPDVVVLTDDGALWYEKGPFGDPRTTGNRSTATSSHFKFSTKKPSPYSLPAETCGSNTVRSTRCH